MDVSRLNNFDFLRLILAIIVIISHSFPLTGNYYNEPLRAITNNELDLGGLAVKGFFVVSGYLIFQSINRSKTFINYLWKRVLRIYPGLFVMLVVTLISILFVYESKESVLNEKSYWTYLPRQMSLYFLQHDIEGVFTNLPYKTINGSLWTIAYEFSMYILFGILFFIKKQFRIIILCIVFIFCGIVSFYFPELLNNSLFSKINLYGPNFYELTTFFASGALLTYINYSKINYKVFISFGLLICLIIFTSMGLYKEVKFLLIPLLIILFGVSSTQYINRISEKIGDLSYGVYIYGWTIQQLLVFNFLLNPYELALFSSIITLFFGYFSWKLIENRFLKYKNLFLIKHEL